MNDIARLDLTEIFTPDVIAEMQPVLISEIIPQIEPMGPSTKMRHTETGAEE